MAMLRYRNGSEWILLGEGAVGDRGPQGDAGANGENGTGLTQAQADTLYLRVTGGTMTGPLDMNGNTLLGAPAGSAASDPVLVSQLPSPLTPPVRVQPAAPVVRRTRDVWVDSDPPPLASDASWTTAVLRSPWVRYSDANYPAPGYRKNLSGAVVLRGLVQGGTTGTILTLPAQYAPKSRLMFMVLTKEPVPGATSVGTALIEVHPSGDVVADQILYSGLPATWLSLSGINFTAGV